MPRSFTTWNDRRRPDPRLFAVPGGLTDASQEDSGECSGPSFDEGGPVDELEQLIAGLLEDGTPLLTPPSCTDDAMMLPEPQGGKGGTLLTAHAAPESQQAHSPSQSVGMKMPPSPMSVPLPPAEFIWRECDSCLVGIDAHGNVIDRTTLPARGTTGLRAHIELQPPLLYWADRRQWMWHKKWSLPTITVRIERDDSAPTGECANGPQPPPAASVERLYVCVSAGTLRDEGCGLEDQGLGGDCQRVLELRPHGAAEVSFTRLLFQQTSFNCGGRPFHLVVTILAAPPRAATNGFGEEAAADAPPNSALKPFVCVCSSPVRVDARKRSKGERPEAAEDDVRLVNRQRPTGGNAVGGSASGGGSQLNQGPAAQVAGLGASAPESGKASIEGQLTEARFSAHALIDATSDAFVEVRPDGVVVQMLSSTAYGYTPAQLLGRSLLTICHTDEHPGLLQTMQALLMMAGAQRAGRGVSQGGDGSSIGTQRAGPAFPRTVRMLHRVIVGLGGERTAEAVAVDTILSVTAAAVEGTAPQTLLLSSRRALPVGADPGAASFAFRIFPWPG